MLIFATKFFFVKIVEFYFYYYLLMVFLFLKKILYLSNYTSAYSRFWKQSFFLFWALELFLFLIYLYLLLNVTSELWSMDLSMVVNVTTFRQSTFYNLIINLLILYFVTWSLPLFFTYKKSLWFLYLCILQCCSILLYIESTQLFYINSYFCSYSYVYDFKESVWELELEGGFIRPVFFYIYIFSLLKIFHLIFIIGLIFFYLFATRSHNLVASTNLSYSNFFFIKQNLMFLGLFYLWTWVVFLKPYISYYYANIYMEIGLYHNFHWQTIILKLGQWNYIIS